jgi:hypothetical protein
MGVTGRRGTTGPGGGRVRGGEPGGGRRPVRGRLGIAVVAVAGVVAAGLGLAPGAGAATPNRGAPSRTGSSSPAATRQTARAAYPASFVGTPMGGQGLAVFSAATGARQRVLTRTKDALGPQVTARPRRVYYQAAGSGLNCTNILRVPYGGGRPAVAHRFVRAQADAFAISPDGRMLAYVWSQQLSAVSAAPCSAATPRLLTVDNLVTGTSHTMTGVPATVTSLAWAPDDRRLVVDLVTAGHDSDEAEVLARPLTAARFAPGGPLACPGRVSWCAEFTPQYDQGGRIVFAACLTPGALTCRYVLARTGATTSVRPVTLASVTAPSRTQDGAWSTTDPAGTAAVFTAPTNSGWATYRWSGGRLTRLRTAVAQVSW